MPCLEPRHDSPADRQHRRDADTDHYADQLVAADLIPCHLALEHIAACTICLARTFDVFVRAYDMDTWNEEERLRKS